MSFPPNPIGIHDMGGNVAEWTEDLLEGGDKSQWHSIRGGTFMYSVASWCLSGHRTTRDSVNGRIIDFGFRVVLEVSAPAAAADKPQAADPARRAAEWVHYIGGRMQISINGKNQTIQSTDELPAVPFNVTDVLLDGRGKAKMTGASLPRLAPLTELVSLKLPAQDISDEDLHHLAKFAELEHLELNWNSKINGAGFQHLKSLPRFHSLDLRGVNIRDVGFEHMKVMENMDHLDLTGVPITEKGIQCLAAMKKLKILHLGAATSINDEAFLTIGQLPELTNLYADSEQISDVGVGHLKGLKKIVHLNLGSSHITGAGLETLGQMTSLQHLLLDGTAIQDHDLQLLGGLKQLGRLGLWNCKVTDAGLEHLKALTALKAVELKGTQVTDAGVASLQAAMARLKIIR